MVGSPIVERGAFQPARAGRLASLGSSHGGDRFIPHRRTSSITNGYHMLMRSYSEEKNSGETFSSPGAVTFWPSSYRKTRNYSVDSVQTGERILCFSPSKCKRKTSTEVLQGKHNLCESLFSPSPKKTPCRQVPKVLNSVFDMPEVTSETYTSPMSWSFRDNLAVALGPRIFNRNCSTGKRDQIPVSNLTDEDNYIGDITALEWNPSGRYLAMGSEYGIIQVFDLDRQKLIPWVKPDAPPCDHFSSISAISWDPSPNEQGKVFYCGSQCGCVTRYDIRKMQDHELFATHIGGVCGIEVSADGRYLATGGDDNLLCVWNIQEGKSICGFHAHDAPIKALSWCPWKSNYLVSGSSGEDGSIRCWNINNRKIVYETFTGSQVTSMAWSLSSRELVTGHGDPYPAVQVHRFPDLQQVAVLSGYRGKVLKLDFSPDCNTLASLSTDETLRSWDGFAAMSPPRKQRSVSNSSPLTMTIR